MHSRYSKVHDLGLVAMGHLHLMMLMWQPSIKIVTLSKKILAALSDIKPN
jgi:hypothetical protein